MVHEPFICAQAFSYNWQATPIPELQYVTVCTPMALGWSGFGEKETADDERVGARAEITAHGVARREHERLAE